MDNFETLTISAAQAISMGVDRQEVIQSLIERELTPEEAYLVYQAAKILAKEPK